MRNQLKFTVGFLIILIILIGGCKDQSVLPQTPELGIPDSEFNSRIHLNAPRGWNTFKFDNFIGINVDVISNDQIAFKHNYGARIFQLKDQEWVEVSNLTKYPEGYVLITQSKGDPFKQGEVSVFPVLGDQNEPVKLRIILIGNIYREGEITGEQTAGSIDVILKP